MEDASKHSNFIQSENIIINGGEFVQNIKHIHSQEPRNFEEEMQTLRQFVAHDAFYDSIKHPYPHNLVFTPAEQDMINAATEWALETEPDGGQRILHLDLTACVSGQYVAQHIAELFEQRTWLRGAFFFSFLEPASRPKNELAGRPDHLFASTLAYQLGINLPDTKPEILGAIRSDPLILTRNTRKQMQCLILEPLRRPGVGSSEMPNIFVLAIGPEFQDLNALHATIAHAIDAAADGEDNSHICFLILKHSMWSCKDIGPRPFLRVTILGAYHRLFFFFYLPALYISSSTQVSKAVEHSYITFTL